MNWLAISAVPPFIAKFANWIESSNEGIKIGKASMDNMPMLLFVFEAMALTMVRVDDKLILPSNTARKNKL